MAFGLGLPEIGIIAVIVILLFVPRKLGDVLGGVGKSIKEFKSAKDGK